MSLDHHSQRRSIASTKYRLVDYARTVRTGCRGADSLFAHMAGLGNQSGLCWQTDRTMGLAIGASERSVTRWLPLLLKGGHIERTYIERYGRRMRAFKLIGPKSASQTGDTSPPSGRRGASQNGGQNPVKGIFNADTERVEYARLCGLDDGPERFAALAAFGRHRHGLS
jgi:hypothetical protein